MSKACISTSKKPAIKPANDRVHDHKVSTIKPPSTPIAHVTHKSSNNGKDANSSLVKDTKAMTNLVKASTVKDDVAAKRMIDYGIITVAVGVGLASVNYYKNYYCTMAGRCGHKVSAGLDDEEEEVDDYAIAQNEKSNETSRSIVKWEGGVFSSLVLIAGSVLIGVGSASKHRLAVDNLL